MPTVSALGAEMLFGILLTSLQFLALATYGKQMLCCIGYNIIRYGENREQTHLSRFADLLSDDLPLALLILFDGSEKCGAL